MPASTSKRVFTVVSCVALGGAVLTASAAARAACPEPDPGQLPYKNAKSGTACTQADIDFFKTEANKADATFVSLETALKAQNAACASCVFTQETDAQWGPIVFFDQGDGAAFVNWGSCFEKAPGGNAACGQSIQKFELCATFRCPEADGYCEDETAVNACVQTVSGDAASCGQYNFEADCPNLAQNEQSCKDIFEAIKVVCGGTPSSTADAGASSSSGSSGKGSSSGSSGSSSGSDDDDDDDDESSSSSGTSGSSGGKKKGTSSSSGTSGAEATPTTTTTEGCAQGSSSAGGSLASGLVVAAAIGAAVSRRRRKD